MTKAKALRGAAAGNEEGGFQAMLETIRNPVLILDPHLIVENANSFFCRKFGQSKAQIEGHFIYQTEAGRWNVPAFRKMLDALLGGAKQIKDVEVLHDSVLMGSMVLLVNGSRMKSPDSKFRIVLSMEEMRDSKKDEHLLRDRVQRSEQALRESGLRVQNALRKSDHDAGQALRKSNKEAGQALRKSNKEAGQALRKSHKEAGQALRRSVKKAGEARHQSDRRAGAARQANARKAGEARQRNLRTVGLALKRSDKMAGQALRRSDLKAILALRRSDKNAGLARKKRDQMAVKVSLARDEMTEQALRFSDKRLRHAMRASDKKAEKVLKEVNDRIEPIYRSNQRFGLAVEGSNDGIWDWDLEQDSIYFSSRWKNMLGFSDEEVGSRPSEWFGRVPADELVKLKSAIAAHVKEKTPFWEHEYRMRHKNGEMLWVHTHGAAQRNGAGKPVRMAGFQADISARRVMQQQLLNLANHDFLTGAFNRRHFMLRLGLRMDEARRLRKPLSLCLCDLDYFKAVNDTYGHPMGDKVLLKFSMVMQAMTRADDLKGRFGGDEFCILFFNKTSAQAGRAVEAIRSGVEKMGLEGDSGKKFKVTGSFGVAQMKPRQSEKEIFAAADKMLYQAKVEGRNRVAIEKGGD